MLKELYVCNTSSLDVHIFLITNLFQHRMIYAMKNPSHQDLDQVNDKMILKEDRGEFLLMNES